ncbi:hypothetical protein WN51_11087 [Melipona quadrifasciata]|uniref:Uncharacterized protein n=1 Tax=Melipona quadrifasciata TaxID=166423 RepID=A0A0M9A3X7_9HYME|nr:hypothetical protein WN51_11087 [Melipona quadrifasciata]
MKGLQEHDTIYTRRTKMSIRNIRSEPIAAGLETYTRDAAMYVMTMPYLAYLQVTIPYLCESILANDQSETTNGKGQLFMGTKN